MQERFSFILWKFITELHVERDRANNQEIDFFFLMSCCSHRVAFICRGKRPWALQQLEEDEEEEGNKETELNLQHQSGHPSLQYLIQPQF